MMAVILIVEDDVFTRDMAEMMIQDWGHHTLLASDVDEALSLLRSPSISMRFLPISISRRPFSVDAIWRRQAIQLRPELRVLYTIEIPSPIK